MLLAALKDHLAKELDVALQFWSDQDEEQDGCVLTQVLNLTQVMNIHHFR